MQNWTKYQLADLYDWVERGMPETVDAGFAEYVQKLTRVFNMRMRFDKFGEKEAIIAHLVAFEPDIKGNRLKALELYNDAMEYFYSSTEISKQAHLNRYADDLDKDITLARRIAQNVNDLEKISKMVERAAKIREAANPDDNTLPEDMLRQPFKVYTMDMNNFDGEGNENLQAVEEFINQQIEQMSPKALDRLKQEALIQLPVKVFQEESENPRKDR